LLFVTRSVWLVGYHYTFTFPVVTVTVYWFTFVCRWLHLHTTRLFTFGLRYGLRFTRYVPGYTRDLRYIHGCLRLHTHGCYAVTFTVVPHHTFGYVDFTTVGYVTFVTVCLRSGYVYVGYVPFTFVTRLRILRGYVYVYVRTRLRTLHVTCVLRSAVTRTLPHVPGYVPVYTHARSHVYVYVLRFVYTRLVDFYHTVTFGYGFTVWVGLPHVYARRTTRYTTGTFARLVYAHTRFGFTFTVTVGCWFPLLPAFGFLLPVTRFTTPALRTFGLFTLWLLPHGYGCAVYVRLPLLRLFVYGCYGYHGSPRFHCRLHVYRCFTFTALHVLRSLHTTAFALRLHVRYTRGYRLPHRTGLPVTLLHVYGYTRLPFTRFTTTHVGWLVDLLPHTAVGLPFGWLHTHTHARLLVYFPRYVLGFTLPFAPLVYTRAVPAFTVWVHPFWLVYHVLLRLVGYGYPVTHTLLRLRTVTHALRTFTRLHGLPFGYGYVAVYHTHICTHVYYGWILPHTPFGLLRFWVTHRVYVVTLRFTCHRYGSGFYGYAFTLRLLVYTAHVRFGYARLPQFTVTFGLRLRLRTRWFTRLFGYVYTLRLPVTHVVRWFVVTALFVRHTVTRLHTFTVHRGLHARLRFAVAVHGFYTRWFTVRLVTRAVVRYVTHVPGYGLPHTLRLPFGYGLLVTFYVALVTFAVYTFTRYVGYRFGCVLRWFCGYVYTFPFTVTCTHGYVYRLRYVTFGYCVYARLLQYVWVVRYVYAVTLHTHVCRLLHTFTVPVTLHLRLVYVRWLLRCGYGLFTVLRLLVGWFAFTVVAFTLHTLRLRLPHVYVTHTHTTRYGYTFVYTHVLRLRFVYTFTHLRSARTHVCVTFVTTFTTVWFTLRVTRLPCGWLRLPVWLPFCFATVLLRLLGWFYRLVTFYVLFGWFGYARYTRFVTWLPHAHTPLRTHGWFGWLLRTHTTFTTHTFVYTRLHTHTHTRYAHNVYHVVCCSRCLRYVTLHRIPVTVTFYTHTHVLRLRLRYRTFYVCHTFTLRYVYVTHVTHGCCLVGLRWVGC